MRLLFMMYPVEDLAVARAGFAAIGFTEAWQPDASAVLLRAPGEEPASVMIEHHRAELALGTGGVFGVGRAETYHAEHQDLDWVIPPCTVPVGGYAAFRTSSGLPVRILDLSQCPQERMYLFGLAAQLRSGGRGGLGCR